MNIPTPAAIARHMGVSDNMASHFLRAFHAAGLEEFGSSFGTVAESAPLLERDSDPLQTLARAAVSGLRLMCMNPTLRDHWRVRDDGSLHRHPQATHSIVAPHQTGQFFNSDGVITDAP